MLCSDATLECLDAADDAAPPPPPAAGARAGAVVTVVVVVVPDPSSADTADAALVTEDRAAFADAATAVGLTVGMAMAKGGGSRCVVRVLWST